MLKPLLTFILSATALAGSSSAQTSTANPAETIAQAGANQWLKEPVDTPTGSGALQVWDHSDGDASDTAFAAINISMQSVVIVFLQGASKGTVEGAKQGLKDLIQAGYSRVALVVAPGPEEKALLVLRGVVAGAVPSLEKAESPRLAVAAATLETYKNELVPTLNGSDQLEKAPRQDFRVLGRLAISASRGDAAATRFLLEQVMATAVREGQPITEGTELSRRYQAWKDVLIDDELKRLDEDIAAKRAALAKVQSEIREDEQKLREVDAHARARGEALADLFLSGGFNGTDELVLRGGEETLRAWERRTGTQVNRKDVKAVRRALEEEILRTKP